MNRRTFVYQLPVLTAASLLPKVAFASDQNRRYVRYISQEIEYPKVIFPVEKRIPLRLTAFPIPSSASTEPVTRLLFPRIDHSSKPVYFRLTAAIDFREEKTIRVYLPESGQDIGVLDIKYAYPFQPFQVVIDPKWLSEVSRQGIALAMIKGTRPPWFFQPATLPSDATGLSPQLLVRERPGSEKEFLRTLCSMNSLSPFGWMGGCVQDALYELRRNGNSQASQILQTQLSYYLDEKYGIILESPRTQPLDGTFNSIEDFLPFAAIVNLYPHHPAIQKAVDFCLDRSNDRGIILAGEHITTEGCYTVAYPLATIAQIRKDAALAQKAVDQLLFRHQYLINNNAVYQRATLEGKRAFCNWGRGVAWYLLGTVKTLRILQGSSFDLPDLDEVRSTFVATVQMVSQWKNSDNLWYAFLDQPQTKIDTSASAGIAAAIVWGHRLGVLPKAYLYSAKATYRSLQKYLTPDGFLTQITQINRGGEALQRGGYRVIAQFGMGLMGQLKAALEA